MTTRDEFTLSFDDSGNKTKITVRRGEEPILIDTVNLALAARRDRFIDQVVEKLPAIDRDEIEAELLQEADRLAGTKPERPEDLVEVDASCIVRPEHFFVPGASGFCIPVVTASGGRPEARWMHYLQWGDGRREVRELGESMFLPDGSRVWVCPAPSLPRVNTTTGWSRDARRAWLNDAAPPDAAGLFQRLCERIAYYIDFPDGVAAGTTATLALWTVLSYVYLVWDAVPYLYFGGPWGSGKTRAFEVLSRLVFRPTQSSNMTAAALFRTLHDRGGSLLVDEAERLKQNTPDVGELRSMLLAGYKRGGQATRLEPVGDSFKSVAFDVYGPKAMACIAGLPSALASRCITVMMFRASPDSPKPKRRLDADPDIWRRLRDDLHELAIGYGPTWNELSSNTEVCPRGIGGRAFELWQPILALAGWFTDQGAVGLLDLVQRHALASLDADAEEQTKETDRLLLEALADLITEEKRPTPAEVLQLAREREAPEFPSYWKPRTASNRLRSFGLRAQKSDRRREYRDVTLETLRRVQLHYGIDLGIGEADEEPTRGDTGPDVASRSSVASLTPPAEPSHRW